jgi:hypothetical protein
VERPDNVGRVKRTHHTTSPGFIGRRTTVLDVPENAASRFHLPNGLRCWKQELPCGKFDGNCRRKTSAPA